MRVEAPSIRALAWRALAFLVGFYALTITLVVALAALPFVVYFVAVRTGYIPVIGILVLAVIAWVPAFALLDGLARIRRPRFVPPGPELTRETSPELFTMLDDLARAAGTAPPSEVYVSPLPLAGVTEVGGRLGVGSRRVLLLGIPILHVIDEKALRAVLAHEMGHYLGGETKLCGLFGFCEEAFRSVERTMMDRRRGDDMGLASVREGRKMAVVIGRSVIGGYARFYLRHMRPFVQRHELAADALSVRLTGRRTVARALETLSAFGAMYDAYLHADVARAVGFGAVPADLFTGFLELRSHLAETGIEAEVMEELRAKRTEPFDHHPSLADRLAALSSYDDGPDDREEDGPAPRSALDVVGDRALLEELLVKTTGAYLSNGGAPKRVPWARMTEEVVRPRVIAEAREAAAPLANRYPGASSATSLLVAITREMATSGVAPIVFHVRPEMKSWPPVDQMSAGNALAMKVLPALLRAAFVEQGAEIRAPYLAMTFLLVWRGAEVSAPVIVMDALRSAQGMARLTWFAEELAAAERANAPASAPAPASGAASGSASAA